MIGSPTEYPERFPTTWWTLIDRARCSATTIRTQALGMLVLRYLPVLRAHLILRNRLSADAADDLLHGFLTEKILEQYLIRHADRTKGKFRCLLLKALENYRIDWCRRPENRRLGCDPSTLAEAAAGPDIKADIFDIAWARQLLDEAVLVMKTECESYEQPQIWGVFEGRLLAPTRDGVEPLSYEALCERFGFALPAQAANVLVTAKRKFRKIFIRVAARYQDDDERADDILHDMIRILSRTDPRCWRMAHAAALHSGSSRQKALDDARPEKLARVLTAESKARRGWRAGRLAHVVRRQLAMRLADIDLQPAGAASVAACSDAKARQLDTVGDLFRHPAPPVTLLVALKRYLRTYIPRTEDAAPRKVAQVLIFAGIAAGIAGHGVRLTDEPDDALREQFIQFLDWAWVQSPLREVFAAALAHLDRRT